MKFQAQFATGSQFIGKGTFNKVPRLYDKISITIATKLYYTACMAHVSP